MLLVYVVYVVRYDLLHSSAEIKLTLSNAGRESYEADIYMVAIVLFCVSCNGMAPVIRS